VGLTLEKLRLRFQENVYYAAPGQGWFAWGVTWGRHKTYPKLADFQIELGVDAGGRKIEPVFANSNGLDFRVTRGMMTSLRQCYPTGPVPGVTLGMLP
jgi:hypothetical protein